MKCLIVVLMFLGLLLAGQSFAQDKKPAPKPPSKAAAAKPELTEKPKPKPEPKPQLTEAFAKTALKAVIAIEDLESSSDRPNSPDQQRIKGALADAEVEVQSKDDERVLKELRLLAVLHAGEVTIRNLKRNTDDMNRLSDAAAYGKVTKAEDIHLAQVTDMKCIAAWKDSLKARSVEMPPAECGK